MAITESGLCTRTRIGFGVCDMTVPPEGEQGGMLKPVTVLVLAAAGPGVCGPRCGGWASARLGARPGQDVSGGNSPAGGCVRTWLLPSGKDLWPGRGRYHELPGLRELAPQRSLT